MASKNISDRDRRIMTRATVKRERMGESPRTISDTDLALMAEELGKKLSERARTISDRDREIISEMQGMKKGGAVSSFGKAFAAARRKHLKGDGPATFTYKGKRYNVQTKEDRKTTVKKVQTGSRDFSERRSKAISKAKAQKRRLTGDRSKIKEVKSPVTRITGKKQPVLAGKVERKRQSGPLTKSEARSAGLTGAGIRSKRKAVTDSQTARKKALSADAKKEASKTGKAKVIVGGALLAAGPGRAAVTKTASALKSVGGAKGAKDIITKTARAVKKERDARKGGFGKFERSPVGELKKQIKTQQTVTKTRATKAATQARKTAELNKKLNAARNRKMRRTATSTAESFGRGMKNVRRARGGVFKGQF